MLDWQQLRAFQEEELVQQDVGAVNLACAAGLPGAPTEAETAECLDRLDHYARHTRRYTEQRMPEFRRDPATYDGSENIFRVLCIVRMLQHGYGIRYNQAKVPDEVPFETPDSFIHGVLLGKGGTCATMPVLYVAIGRRLGYPLKLVSAPGHQFCRWEEPGGERFNIEATGNGMATPPDDHYRAGRYALPPGLEKHTFFVKSHTRQEETATFVAQRAMHCDRSENYREAVEAFVWAYRLAPAHKVYEDGLVTMMNRWLQKLKRMLPPNFPRLSVRMPPARRYPWLPPAVEKDVLSFSAWESLMTQPEFERIVMKPLWASPHARPAGLPDNIVINVK